MAYEIHINGSIDNYTESYLRKELEAAGGKPVLLKISSGGGSVFSGMACVSLIQSYSGIVNSEIIGLAGSMAAVLAAASTGTVTVYDHSSYLIHLSSMNGVSGNEIELEQIRDVLKKIDLQILKILCARSNLSTVKVLEMLRAETWFFGKEIFDNGFADKIKTDGSIEDKITTIKEAKAQYAACYKAPTMAGAVAYLKSSTSTGNSNEVEKLNKLIEPALSADDKTALKLFKMTEAEYRQSQAYLKQFEQ